MIKKNISTHATDPLSASQMALSQIPHLFKLTEKLPLVSVAYDHTTILQSTSQEQQYCPQFN